MTLDNFNQARNSEQSFLSGGDHLQSFRDSIYGSTNGATFKTREVRENEDSLKSILPRMEITGCQESVLDDATSVLRKLWNKVFGPTEHEQIVDKIVKSLKPEEKDRYDEEEKQIEKFKQEVRNWNVLSTLNPPPFPKAPHCPIHVEVNKRAQEEEGKPAS